MELVLGKKFRLEVWETVVQAMAVGEIAAFHVDKSVSKILFITFKLCKSLTHYLVVIGNNLLNTF